METTWRGDGVRCQVDAGVAELMVDRPETRNAIARSTAEALEGAVAWLAERVDAGVARVVVVCGGGGRFIAGGDLRDLAVLRTAEDGREMSRRMRAVCDRLAGLPVPVVAALDAFALGGGAEIALAADLRVLAADAFIAFRHADFGVSTAWGGTRRLAALVGPSRASRLLWTGAAVHAEEALAMGLVDRVAPTDSSARVEAMALARRLADHAPGAVRATKRLVQASASLSPETHGELETEIFGETWAAKDHWDRVDAFWAARSAPADGGVAGRAVAGPPAERTVAENADGTPRGRFIVLEGLDGAGTTTQARLLVRWLRRAGRRVHQTAEPSTGPLGTLLRQAIAARVRGADGAPLDPGSIALLFAADRIDHLRGEIEPALARGEDVICDRYVWSSLAYQGVDSPRPWLVALNAPMRAPDLTLYVRVPVEVAAARRARRGGAPDLYENDPFQTAVAEGYREAARARPADRWVEIDGAGSPRAVQRACRAAIDALPVR